MRQNFDVENFASGHFSWPAALVLAGAPLRM
jgi:hypothetical protein